MFFYKKKRSDTIVLNLKLDFDNFFDNWRLMLLHCFHVFVLFLKNPIIKDCLESYINEGCDRLYRTPFLTDSFFSIFPSCCSGVTSAEKGRRWGWGVLNEGGWRGGEMTISAKMLPYSTPRIPSLPEATTTPVFLFLSAALKLREASSSKRRSSASAIMATIYTWHNRASVERLEMCLFEVDIQERLMNAFLRIPMLILNKSRLSVTFRYFRCVNNEHRYFEASMVNFFFSDDTHVSAMRSCVFAGLQWFCLICIAAQNNSCLENNATKSDSI